MLEIVRWGLHEPVKFIRLKQRLIVYIVFEMRLGPAQPSSWRVPGSALVHPPPCCCPISGTNSDFLSGQGRTCQAALPHARGVVEAGKTVMEIVPVGERLLIEVRVRPQDIDNVKIGQQATIKLTTLKERITPMIAGEVVYLLANTFPDEKGAQIPVASFMSRELRRLRPK
jgi:hypothetical protein